MNVKTNIDQFTKVLIAERERQESLYGKENEMNSMSEYCTILGEEYGEVCKATYERKPAELEKELIHVAAVAFAMWQRLQSQKPAEETIVDERNQAKCSIA